MRVPIATSRILPFLHKERRRLQSPLVPDLSVWELVTLPRDAKVRFFMSLPRSGACFGGDSVVPQMLTMDACRVLGTRASNGHRSSRNHYNRSAFLDVLSISVTANNPDPNCHSIKPEIPLKSFLVGLLELIRKPVRCCPFLDLQIPPPAFCKQSPSTFSLYRHRPKSRPISL